MCCVCVIIPFILAVRLVDASAAGVTQEDCHTGFLCLPFAELALIFLARRFQSFPSSTVKWNFLYPRMNRSPLIIGHFLTFFFIIFVRKNTNSCDCAEVRADVVPTSDGFEVTR